MHNAFAVFLLHQLHIARKSTAPSMWVRKSDRKLYGSVGSATGVVCSYPSAPEGSNLAVSSKCTRTEFHFSACVSDLGNQYNVSLYLTLTAVF